jgi:hypothetical protein
MYAIFYLRVIKRNALVGKSTRGGCCAHVRDCASDARRVRYDVFACTVSRKKGGGEGAEAIKPYMGNSNLIWPIIAHVKPQELPPFRLNSCDDDFLRDVQILVWNGT